MTRYSRSPWLVLLIIVSLANISTHSAKAKKKKAAQSGRKMPKGSSEQPDIEAFRPKPTTRPGKEPKKGGKGWTSAEGWDRLEERCTNGTYDAEAADLSSFKKGDIFFITGKQRDNRQYCMSVKPSPDGFKPVYPMPLNDFKMAPNEQWTFEHPPWAADDEWVVIQSMSNGFCLDVKGENTENGTPVGAFFCEDGNVNQMFRIINGASGMVYIQDYNSCKCLSVKVLKKSKRSVLSIADCKFGKRRDQLWSLTRPKAVLTVSFWTHAKKQGEHVKMESWGQCVEIPNSFKKQISSVDPHGKCVKVFEQLGCVGDNLDYGSGARDPKHFWKDYWNDRVVSFKPCK